MAKKENRIVLQSFVPYDLTVNFRHLEGEKKGEAVKVGNVFKTLAVPSKFSSPKNIVVLTKEDFAGVKLDLETYITMGQKGGIVILEDIPSGYWDPAQRVAAAETAKQAAETALAGALKTIEEKDARILELTDILTRTYAWKGDGK